MLLSSACLPPVAWFAQLYACDGQEVLMEQWDHYVKQTLRNRYTIASADGPLTLTIPVDKGPEAKCLMKDVRISDHGNWRHQHWNALTTAYAATPFFLYYEDDFRPFFEQRYTFLFDFNLELMSRCCELIDIHPQLKPTESYTPASPLQTDDLRGWVDAKNVPPDGNVPVPYWQVFADRQGFQPGLSIVDLLFNMGPESILVLQQTARQTAQKS